MSKKAVYSEKAVQALLRVMTDIWLYANLNGDKVTAKKMATVVDELYLLQWRLQAQNPQNSPKKQENFVPH